MRLVPLERALSKLNAASRTSGQRLIRDGAVTVNGRTVRQPLQLVDLDHDEIRVAGRRAAAIPFRAIALHKPRGTITSRRDPQGRRTVFDLLGEAGAGLVAVGRLDYASSGLLLLTTDTALADDLTSPAHAVPRQYVVTARGLVTDEEAARLEAGIGALRASAVRILKRSRRETHLSIELAEGKNREIRRLLEAVEHEVTRLLRVSFGPIELGALQPGQWRDLPREAFAFIQRS